MPTQRLLLLGALVLVLGSCAIWYMKMILPEATTIDETVAVKVPTNLPNMDEKTAGMADDAITTNAPATAPGASAPTLPPPSATAPVVSGSIDADVAAISDAVDAPYDDSSLDAQFTSEGAAAITADYDL